MPDQASMAFPLLRWYHQVKRDLPWRQTQDPYCIWISEIMLQQTRVETVKGYYARFLSLFPTVSALAAAPEQEVLKAWEGLGYYSRARNLQKAAQAVTQEGRFPSTYDGLLKLPGIGAYTAGAIASICFGQRVPAIDGNVYRVAARYFGVREDIGSPAAQRLLRQQVTDSLPEAPMGDFNQALMELGATVCLPGTPKCDLCPLRDACDAYAQGDAQLLPVHMKKRPPKAMDVAVCLLTYENHILVLRRQQKLLHGLYVFFLVEEESDVGQAQALLEQQGLACSFAADCGRATHVFTHRLWDMRLLHFRLIKKPSDSLLEALQARLVTRQELEALPLPSAMRAAKAQAILLL